MSLQRWPSSPRLRQDRIQNKDLWTLKKWFWRPGPSSGPATPGAGVFLETRTSATAETHTDARPSADVHRHSRRALAEEGAGSVDALPVDANSRKHLTLVHIWRSERRDTFLTAAALWNEAGAALTLPSHTFPRTLAKPFPQIGSAGREQAC